MLGFVRCFGSVSLWVYTCVFYGGFYRSKAIASCYDRLDLGCVGFVVYFPLLAFD